jgi:molecular chaperone GrpE (heat shock protein)
VGRQYYNLDIDGGGEMEHSKLPWFIDYTTSVETNIKNDERLDICMCAGNDENAAGSDNAEFIVEACNNYERLLVENKQWETNYNNLSAEFEEVSAIAQAQKEQIEKFARALVHTWDNVFATNPVSESIEEALQDAREIVYLGGK